MASLATVRPYWDPLVRIAHWGIAAGVIANRLLTEGGSGFHIWIGYAVAALLVARLLWGLIGSPPARFSSFPPNPAAALRHIRDIRERRIRIYRSHNPLGALMAYALWATLLVVGATGIVMARADSVASRTAPVSQPAYVEPRPFSPEEGEQEREGREREEREEGMVGEIHELAANVLLALAIVHVAGVVFETRRGERGLARAMITGGGCRE